MPLSSSAVVLAASLFCFAPQASAELTFAEKAEAAKLADEGMFFFNRGEFTQAVEKFEQAEAIVAAPTIVLAHGRALEKLGRWVLALSKFEAAANHEPGPGAAWQQRTAKADAKREWERLEPTVPRVLVTLLPSSQDITEFAIDGRKLDIPQPTEPLRLDPGKHVITAKRTDGADATAEISLSAGQTLEVQLSLRKAVVAPPDPAPNPLRIAGFVGVGVSGAMLLVAAGTGIPAIVMADDFEELCAGGTCPESEADALGTYDGLRWTAGITLIAGAVIGGGAAALLSLTPPEERGTRPETRVRPWLGPRVAGVEVSFP